MKKIVLILTVCALLLCLGGCKSSYINLTYRSNFEYAIVELPSGEVMSIEISDWTFNSCGFYVITNKNGKKYIVPITRCVLIGGEEDEA